VVELEACFDAMYCICSLLSLVYLQSYFWRIQENSGKNKYEPLNQAYMGEWNFEKLACEVLQLRDSIKIVLIWIASLKVM